MRPAAIAGTNLELAKSHNRRVVIEAVRLNGALSRAEIARLTALSSQTISNIVAELEERDIRGARQRQPVPGDLDRADDQLVGPLVRLLERLHRGVAGSPGVGGADQLLAGPGGGGSVLGIPSLAKKG